MTMKRALIASVLTQVAGLAVATAQPTPPPPDGDEAQPSDVETTAQAPAEGAPAPEAGEQETVAEEVAAPEIDRGEGVAEVGYDKGFFIKSGDGKHTLKITSRVQPFYNGTFNANDVADKHNFEIRRARLTLE